MIHLVSLVTLLWSTACVAAAEPVEWSFEAGTAGWHVLPGLALEVGLMAGSKGLDLMVPPLGNGGLQVVGAPSERMFLDASGYVRRGSVRSQWLLSPEIRRPARDFTHVALRFRGSAGTHVTMRLQWLTVESRGAFRELDLRQRELVLPDSVSRVMGQFADGAISGSEWEAYIRHWEQADGRAYRDETERMQQEHAFLNSLLQTEEFRVECTGRVQTAQVPMAARPGWQGDILALGIWVAGEPQLLTIPTQVASQAPLLTIDAVRLK